jgi:thioredoxin 1
MPVVWRMRIAVMGTALLALATLLGGCGGADPATTDSTVASSVSTNPPDSASPIAGSGLPQLVDLGSEGCVPCDMMAGELEALAQQYKGSVDVVFVDVNKSEEGAALARELGIQIIPTQIFLDPDGNELARHEGYMSKEDIVRAFQEYGYPLRRGFGSLDQGLGGGGAGA